MHFHKEVVKKYHAQWVHCHSVYGVHHGFVYKVMHDGIILTHCTGLAQGQQTDGSEFEAGVYNDSDGPDVQHVQFFGGPGMFIPYGGMFGLWPAPGFII
ncbi:hypothetical protein LLE49_00675 [Alicyclobacillus tolerans]|uniref:hypothetical protein n=1 Tax=Alicyclobacillus tolerans TaxID=90970 RepID=UPI001F2E9D6E|nr:hypothetical protein [Alicyclobacillus tolerans]MCF8563258.1 hypothetical protein [Alicyclobacillus tolerans]